MIALTLSMREFWNPSQTTGLQDWRLPRKQNNQEVSNNIILYISRNNSNNNENPRIVESCSHEILEFWASLSFGLLGPWDSWIPEIGSNNNNYKIIITGIKLRIKY